MYFGSIKMVGRDSNGRSALCDIVSDLSSFWLSPITYLECACYISGLHCEWVEEELGLECGLWITDAETVSIVSNGHFLGQDDSNKINKQIKWGIKINRWMKLGIENITIIEWMSVGVFLWRRHDVYSGA